MAAVLGLALLAGPLSAQDTAQVRQARDAQQELRTDSASQQDVHPQDSPEYRGFVIETRDRRSSLRILGSVRASGVLDFKGLQGTRDFAVYDIPVGPANTSDSRVYLEASQSRFGFEAHTRQRGAPDLFVRIESDFRGQQNTLRLRHAYVSAGRILFGQTWTTAAHVSTLPTTVDAEGPNSAITNRSTQFRYTAPLDSQTRFAVAIEAPAVDTRSTDTLPVYPRIPDLVGRIRRARNGREMQVAVILRSIAARDSLGVPDDVVGYGVAVSGRFTFRGQKDELLFQGLYGHGVSRYVAGLSGRGLDAVQDSATGNLYSVPVGGGYVSYGRLLRWGMKAYATVGYTRVTNRAFEPPDAYHRGGYLAASVFRDFVWGARAGGEVTWGRRLNKNGEGDTAVRFQCIVYYDF
jgi:hypothetical protein